MAALEAEAIFEGEQDRLDPLADPAEHRAAAGLVAARGTQNGGAVALGRGGFEVAAGLALLADDQLAAVQPDREQPERDVALLSVGGGEDRRPGGAVRGGQQVQPLGPESP